jgi:hypothetical protein
MRAITDVEVVGTIDVALSRNSAELKTSANIEASIPLEISSIQQSYPASIPVVKVKLVVVTVTIFYSN